MNTRDALKTLDSEIGKSLEKDRWHKALLEKMTLEIDGIRPKVISDPVYRNLLELLKFRHFTHYYFELDYDWDKLNFLLKKFNHVKDPVKKEISTFRSVLSSLLNPDDK